MCNEKVTTLCATTVNLRLSTGKLRSLIGSQNNNTTPDINLQNGAVWAIFTSLCKLYKYTTQIKGHAPFIRVV